MYCQSDMGTTQFFIRFNSVSERFDSNQLMTHNGFTRIDSDQLTTQNWFLNFDSNRLTSQKAFRIFWFKSTHYSKNFPEFGFKSTPGLKSYLEYWFELSHDLLNDSIQLLILLTFLEPSLNFVDRNFPHFSILINSWLKRKVFDSESIYDSTLSHTHVCCQLHLPFFLRTPELPLKVLSQRMELHGLTLTSYRLTLW